MGYTPEAKKAAATQLANLMQSWVQMGYVPPQAMQVFIKNVLEYFDYGNTQEFMDSVNVAQQQQMPQTQLDQIKVAVAQVMGDIEKAKQGQPVSGGGGQPSQGPAQSPAPVSPRPQKQPNQAPGQIAPL